MLEQVIKFYNAGEFSEALSLCEELLANNASAEVFYWKATNLLRLDQLNEALVSNGRGLKLFPDNPNLLSLDGVILFHLKRNSDALIRMNRAVDLEPQNPYRYSSRAFIKDAMGDTKGAIDDYEITIQLDPDDSIAHNNIGLLKEKLGYKEKAQQHFKKADRLAVDENGSLVSFEPNEKADSLEIESSSSDDQQADDQPKESLGLSYFFKTLKDVFASSKERKAFLQFLFGRSKS